MKMTAFIGSGRKKFTYELTRRFLDNLKKNNNIEYELVNLCDYRIEICRGCKLCFDKGEEQCPLKDDRDLLLSKIRNSDAILFSSPNYAFHISGFMKVFLDRISFCFHRPEFFGKAFTSITVQGIYGGNKIIKYFNFIGKALGFNVFKGVCLNTIEPMTDKQKIKNETLIDQKSEQFYKFMGKEKLKTPSLFDLIMFRISRSMMKSMLTEEFRDYTYYRDKGWFESDFYYNTKLGFIKNKAGKIIDYIIGKKHKRN